MNCCTIPVHIAQTHFTGEYLHVAHLSKTGLRYDELQHLLAAGKILASQDGKKLAHLISRSSDKVQVCVGNRTYPYLFEPENARLLSLERGITFSGKCTDGRSGLFRIVGEKLLHLSGSEPVAVQRGPTKTLIFIRNVLDPPDTYRIFGDIRTEGFPIHKKSFVAPVDDGHLLVLEPVGGKWFQYIVGTNESTDFQQVPYADATIAGFARWMGMTILGLRGKTSSVLEFVGDRGLLNRHRIQVDGELEHLWQSPTQNGLAWVSRVSLDGQTFRRLVVNNAVILEDEFAVGPFDLQWSLDGTQAAAVVRQGMNGLGPSWLVSREHQINIRPERTIKEFLIEDDGNISAWIESNGRFSYPMIHGIAHDAVETAWNLHATPTGAIYYCCMMANVILRVEDQTYCSTTDTQTGE